MAHKHVLNDRIISIVRHYGQALEDRGVKFHHIIVFGSQTKGTARPWSDIDVCVVSDQFGKDRHSERVSLMHARDDSLLDIEPHPYHPRDLADIYDPLASEIRKYGIQVI